MAPLGSEGITRDRLAYLEEEFPKLRRAAGDSKMKMILTLDREESQARKHEARVGELLEQVGRQEKALKAASILIENKNSTLIEKAKEIIRSQDQAANLTIQNKILRKGRQDQEMLKIEVVERDRMIAILEKERRIQDQNIQDLRAEIARLMKK